jgi:hypothetical protein
MLFSAAAVANVALSAAESREKNKRRAVNLGGDMQHTVNRLTRDNAGSAAGCWPSGDDSAALRVLNGCSLEAQQFAFWR